MLLPVGVGPLDRKVTLEQGERSRKIARDGQAQRSGRRGRVGQHRWKALLQRAVRPHRGVLAVAAHVAELGQDRRKPSSSLSAELVAPVPCLPRQALGPLQVSGELGDLGLEVETPGALPKTCQLLPKAEAAPTSPASRKSSTAAIIRASASGPGSVTRAASRVSSAARCRAPPCWCASAHEARLSASTWSGPLLAASRCSRASSPCRASAARSWRRLRSAGPRSSVTAAFASECAYLSSHPRPSYRPLTSRERVSSSSASSAPDTAATRPATSTGQSSASTAAARASLRASSDWEASVLRTSMA